MVMYSFQRSLNDVDDISIPLDFPREWQDTLIYNLAARLMLIYDAPSSKISMISSLATQFLQESLGFDIETSSMKMQPNLRG